MLSVWGFNRLTVAGFEDGTDYVHETLERANQAARDRGINPSIESDALDASRDVTLSEATCNAPWRIVDGTLYVVYGNVVSLDKLIADNHVSS